MNNKSTNPTQIYTHVSTEQFEKITSQIQVWLKTKFITKRGANCFDGQEAYDKFMAKRNAER